MPGYYFELAIRSLRRNVALTALMIGAVGVGIGTSMTALTALRSMSADPIPEKSARLFTPQLDAWGTPVGSSRLRRQRRPAAHRAHVP